MSLVISYYTRARVRTHMERARAYSLYMSKKYKVLLSYKKTSKNLQD